MDKLIITVALTGNVPTKEMNPNLPDGSPASNPRLVEMVVAIAKEIGRKIASLEETRSCLSLNPQIKNRIITQQIT